MRRTTDYIDGSYSIQYLDDNEELHREHGPALTYYLPNGTVSFELFYCHGKKHNSSGPAFITYRPNGVVRYVEYYLDDTEVSESDFKKEGNML